MPWSGEVLTLRRPDDRKVTIVAASTHAATKLWLR
jgi:hypothetical protein